jgi:hypothetical protein
MLETERYYVMYDHSTFGVSVRTDATVYNTVTWLVASYSDLEAAMNKAEDIRSGRLDLFEVPGPWQKLGELYEEMDDIDKQVF